MKRIHYIQHEPYEGIGWVEDWANSNGYTLSGTHIYNDDIILTDVDSFDWLVIMGGPNGANDPLDSIQKELELIKKAIEANKTVIGFCLGAQLIAKALGAKVYRNKFKEIGWFPIQKVSDHYLFEHFQDEQLVFQWHADTFDIPTGALHLMKSQGCINQAFVYNDKVVAMQFHVEVKADGLKSLMDIWGSELKPATYVQSEDFVNEHIDYAFNNRDLLFKLLDKLNALK